MAYEGAPPIPVKVGGTGISSAVAYAPLCGGTTTTAPLQSASTGMSTVGNVLTSNGASALPTWQAGGGTAVATLAGDTGTATGSTVTLTAAATSLNFLASGSTASIAGTLTLAHGGAGAGGPFTGVVSCNGSLSISATAVTAHRVLIGGGTNNMSQLAATGATGTVLTGATGNNPTFSATPAVTSLSIGGSTLSAYQNNASWTPSLTGSATAGTTTYTTQVGRYMRIGNIVYVFWNMVISAATGTGDMLIGGFPFTLRNTSTFTPLGYGTINSSLTFWPTGTKAMFFQGIPNTKTANIWGFASGATTAKFQMANQDFNIVGGMIFAV